VYLAAPRRWLLEWFRPERFQRSLFAGYCMAVGLTATALLGRSWLEPFLGDRVPFAFFFLAVAITAWFGGFGPCLLAVALGTLASWYFVLDQRHSFALVHPFQLFGLAAFVLTGVVIASFSGRVRNALDALYAAQQESERRARDAEVAQQTLLTLLTHIPEGITMAGGPPEFPIIAHSSFAESVIGSAAKQVIGMPAGKHNSVVGFLHPESLAAPVEKQVPLYRATRHGETIENESWVIRRPNGALLHASVNTVPIRDATGLIIGGITCWRDVTEQKRLLEALKESERRFRGFAEHTQDVLWITRADRYELVYVNRAFERVFGRPAAEIQRDLLYFLSYVFDEDRQLVRTAWERSRQGLSVEEYRVVHPRGSLIWIRDRAFPIFNDWGEAEYVAGIAEDITEEKRIAEERERLLESERAARLDAERSSRVKDEFLATLSHELRTPLNAIVGWLHILKTQSRSEEVLAQAIAVIERNSHAQKQLIEDLLDMSRIVLGKFRLDLKALDLLPLVRAAIDSVLPAAEAKAIRVQEVLDPAAGPVKADPDRIQQIVWNLVSNAVKFTPSGGDIQVRLERVNGYAEIRVSDTGRGIRSEFLPFVFERFRQEDASSKREHRGLGLGLAIVKQLVEQHGGTVTVESAGENQGATFAVCLPIAVAAHPNVEMPSDRAFSNAVDTSFSGLRFLVVDDDPDSLAVLRRLLEERHAQVEVASSAGEALSKIASWPPDLLISDVGMPVRDGYDLIRDVRALPSSIPSDIPAIAVTAFTRRDDRTRAFQAGYNAHVPKPVNPVELLSVVSSLLPPPSIPRGETDTP